MHAGGISNFSIFGMVQLPMSLAPFGALVITSVIIPQASFIGHLSGILMGYLMAYVLYGMTVNLWASLVLLALLGAGKQRHMHFQCFHGATVFETWCGGARTSGFATCCTVRVSHVVKAPDVDAIRQGSSAVGADHCAFVHFMLLSCCDSDCKSTL